MLGCHTMGPYDCIVVYGEITVVYDSIKNTTSPYLYWAFTGYLYDYPDTKSPYGLANPIASVSDSISSQRLNVGTNIKYIAILFSINPNTYDIVKPAFLQNVDIDANTIEFFTITIPTNMYSTSTISKGTGRYYLMGRTVFRPELLRATYRRTTLYGINVIRWLISRLM